ncbi:hypothetical protein Theam_1516 [Thermovibrio ammonificans HB-1]|uniref:T2SS protein K first SAM-like domain-containing protein n=1 Tax=Thermovibrio ammonificans (strain DSM 15698 / JCM 12110 / HB-1) TaxID=648996 RepID=E8T4L9_THEA1|nr:type II secretion system minor pseudopilin GspK [Thermovibrio ammonificans]ADU97477.1 hypothetical protein Theam_1516 [Thermovibrio ammonificans HB-1]
MSSSPSRRGFVLFIVLVVVAVLAAFLFSVLFLSSQGVKRSEAVKDYTVAYHAAVSAVKIALKYLKEDDNSFDGTGDDWAKPIHYNYSGVALSIRIEDLCGKLNVNKLTNPVYFKVGKRLFEELNLNPDLLDALKDWIDKDSRVTGDGAEADYYEAFGYKPSNSPMKSLGELYYVKGFTYKVVKKVKPYFTVYGSGKVNVNSAGKKLLMALSDRITPTLADSIIEARPIRKLQDLLDIPGFTRELYFEIRPIITNRCNYFRVEVTASYGDATASVVALTTRRRILEWKVVE